MKLCAFTFRSGTRVFLLSLPQNTLRFGSGLSRSITWLLRPRLILKGHGCDDGCSLSGNDQLGWQWQLYIVGILGVYCGG
jgi:hypothetical protein